MRSRTPVWNIEDPFLFVVKCLMLYVRRCSQEVPLRLSHYSRRNSVTLLDIVLPLQIFVLDIDLSRFGSEFSGSF